jgi:hypothetical protein
MIVEELESELEASLKAASLLDKLRELESCGNRLDFERNVYQRKLDRLARDLKSGADPGPLRKLAKAASERYAASMRARLEKVDRRIRDNDVATEMAKREYDRAFNPRWGPLFKDGNEVSRFGQQVQRFACVYTSKVSNFGSYPPNKYFRSPIGLMPHDL